ncbi:EMILIN-3 [Osmerus mordax]|uniref:EMILIN-3 n=1 Tax=Osmerus mordax TaxID=8014 RepID=UPI0035105D75
MYKVPILILTVIVSLAGAKFYSPNQYNLYKAGASPHHGQGNPTGRHKNHCAYVVEKSVSFTMQDGAAPYVKAEYNKCSWGQKCPTLIYRLMYKPHYKVAYKTQTELEWRCCPGYSGYGCMEEPPAYHQPMKMMPPFKGPSFKGPPFKGPQFKGPPVHPGLKANPWSQPKRPPSNVKSYPMRHFGPPMTSYTETSFEPFPSEPEPDHHPQQQPEADHPEHEPEHETEQESEQESEHEHDREHDHEHEQEREHRPQETPPPGGSHDVDGQDPDSETEERLGRMEEDVRRLSQGLETLKGTLTGLEDALRASLREDANRMLSTLLSASPGPVPAPALASSHSVVGFGDIPGGDPEAEGLDGGLAFTGLGELTSRVEQLRTELKVKSAELQELRGMVVGHDGTLRRLSGDHSSARSAGKDSQKFAEELVDGRLGASRAEILGGFEQRMEVAEGRCEEKAGEVRRQCQREQEETQEQLEQALEGSATGLKKELGHLQAQIQRLDTTEGCSGRMVGLAERVHLLEQSVAGLNQSQGHLRVELGGHKDHVEGMLEGRLGYVEARLNLTGKVKGVSGATAAGETRVRERLLNTTEVGLGLEARLEGKLKALEGRLLTAVEELGNATAPALLEGHAVPTLETELESLRQRLELDVDRVQRQLSGLESLCTSSCSSSPPSGLQGDAASLHSRLVEEEDNMKGLLDAQAESLTSLNSTLQKLLVRLDHKDHQQEDREGNSLQGELMVLKFNVRSVNRTLRSLKDSVGLVAREVGRANSTWQEREERLAQQVKGVVQLVGRQASMLGAGERRLTRLKAELQELRRRLAGEVQGCKSTALGVQKEVTEVGGRVASVEGQCKGLSHLAEDLERIRAELERQSDGHLSQVNGTLSSHALQLSELRDGLRNCTAKLELSHQRQPHSLEPEQRRGDQ